MYELRGDSDATTSRIVIGNSAGHRLLPADITVSYHCIHGQRVGLYHVRKWLANREAFNYDSRLGWAYDRWFTWFDELAEKELSDE